MTESPNGRGLLTPQELAEVGPPEAVRLPLELIDPNPRNPRGHLVEVDALAENIKVFGLLQPVTVRRQGERYELLGGHRRLAAFAKLRESEPLEPQWRTIPAVIRTFDDDTGYLALISGQVHNRAWRPREEASALEQLVIAGRNLRQIGEALNRTEAWASKRLRVYSDAVLSAFVQTGALSTGVAEELLPIADVAMRKAFAERAIAEQWSQDQARSAVRHLRLDKQLPELGRRTQELLDILEHVRPEQIPLDVTRNLWTLHGRIETLSGRQPQFPTIEAAQRAAGIREIRRQAQRPGTKRKPGYKPRV